MTAGIEEAETVAVAGRVPGGDLSGIRLFALYLALGLIALGFVWTTVHRRSMGKLSATAGPIRDHAGITHWLDHGFFASFGMLWPVPDGNVIYASRPGAGTVTGFLVERVWTGLTGRYGWRLLALHNEVVVLLISVFLAILAYRITRRFGVGPLHAFILGVAVQMVWFTFPDNLASVWLLWEQTYCLVAVIGFLLIEERALDGGRTRLMTTLQALAVFALTSIECVSGTMFVVAYAAIVSLLRGERPSFRRLGATLLLPWLCAFSLFGLQLLGARYQAKQAGARLQGSSFQYRSGLDGDAMFYGDHLDIAFGRDVVRGGHPFLYRWPWLFLAGAAAVVATLLAYVGHRVPRIAVVVLLVLLGSYLLYAAVFSQAVALHPYLFDVMLATPLILALFAIVPALVESRTQFTGTIVLIAIFGSLWLSMFQLRLYALRDPMPQPAAVMESPQSGGR